MILLYTGAEIAGLPQNDPESSLGGNVSNSPISSGVKNNLFSGISKNIERFGITEVRGIVLKNTSGLPVENVYFYFEPETPEDLATFEVAAVTIVNNAMERISSPYALPLSATFVEATGEPEKVLLTGSLEPNQQIGIWIKRIVAPISLPTDEEYCQTDFELLKLESPEIVVEYTTA